MRSTAVVDDLEFGEAERSAIRLDGDAFPLGEALVPVDQPVDAGVRAAALTPAVRSGDLVVAGASAAWVHGALPLLARPYDLAADLNAGRRARRGPDPVREVRFGPGDVERLRGVRVTTPLRTAFDLLRRDPVDQQVVLRLLAGSGIERDRIPAALTRLPGAPRKRVAILRARILLGWVSPS